MKAFGLTDMGMKREKNEDSILMNETISLYIVADGMGGHMLGEVASQTAVNIINESIEKSINVSDDASLQNNHHIKELLRESLNKANKEIYDYSQNLSEEAIMGTTVALALIKNKKLYVAHVGDSRIYRLRKGVLEKLTKDHTKAQELVDSGLLPEKEADNHSSSHILTRALGVTDSVSPDIGIHDVNDGYRFLLSSDGLFRVLDVDAVRDVLSSGMSLEDKCRTLIDKTLEGGAPDNVTLIIVKPQKKGFFGRIFS